MSRLRLRDVLDRYEVRCLDLKPSEVLIVRVDADLDEQKLVNLKERIAPFFPNNKVLVTTGPISFEVVDQSPATP